jgi:hypothetical protein
MLPTVARLVAGIILVLALVACPATPAAGVDGVTIDGGDRSLAVGGTLTLTVTVATTGNASGTVTWRSSREDVATIDPAGHLTGHAAGSTDITATSTADPTKSDTITVTVTPPGTLAWTRQFGSDGGDIATGIATDANGNVYASGYTTGALEGANAGDHDAFVRSYDGGGNHRWTRQFGTTGGDYASGIATDANGNVFTSGHTTGALEGATAGGIDAFVRSNDGAGNHRWTRQFGTGSDDYGVGIATDASGNVYTSGYTTCALDGANAGLFDAFVRSYDGDGNHRWTRQFGTGVDDRASGIATDANGNVYVTGSTGGDLEGASAGNFDAFVRSYDGDGNHRWTRQFGTSSGDASNGVATDANGDVYVAGSTLGALAGASSGGIDAFVRTYGGDGTHRWTRQFGTGGSDVAEGIATDANGDVYATGHTDGALEGTSAGSHDGFIRKYGP